MASGHSGNKNQDACIPNLHKFAMRQLELDRHFIMINGKRNSGKSTLLAEILYQHRYFRKFVIMSGSERTVNGFYTELSVPKIFIKRGFDPVYLDRLWKLQCVNPKSCCLILDDLSFNNDMWKNETLNTIINAGRHAKLGLIFASQYIMHIPLELRQQVDWVFTMGDNSRPAQDRMYDAFFSYVETKKIFKQIFMHFTDNHGVLVSDNASMSHDLKNCMYWFKATPRKYRFHVGCETYRALYEEDQSLTDEEKEIDKYNHKHAIDTVYYNKEGTQMKSKNR